MTRSIQTEQLCTEKWNDWIRSQSAESWVTPALYKAGTAAFAFSQYVATECQRHPEVLLQLLQSGQLERVFDGTEAFATDGLPSLEDSEASFMAHLRHYRRKHMIWLYWRDLAGLASLEETCKHISWLADTCLKRALDWSHHHFAQKFNIEHTDLLPLIVLAMGKYGAHELNVSSDIDLIFIYSDEQSVPASLRSLENYYLQLGRKLIQLLDQRTAEGFVFRVDMRLRPYGESGPLVMSQTAAESYYLEQGRDWERFAMIKARFVTGTPVQQQALLEVLRPFVFRRYVDFSVLDAPRQMKSRIESEIRRRNLTDNIKLGAGGIREVEFIAQALQLIHGGREPRLQCRGLFEAIVTLADCGLIEASAQFQLHEGYLFLRHLEHRVQAWKDEQTQTLPTNEAQCLCLARSMGYSNWAECASELEQHQQQIHTIFKNLFVSEYSESPSETDILFNDIWLAAESDDDFQSLLTRAGLEQPEKQMILLRQFRQNSGIRNMGPRGQGILDRLMPQMLQSMAKHHYTVEVLDRVIRLINAVIRRTAYLELLYENPAASNILLKLCNQSALIADYLTDYPYTLDELLSPSSLMNPPLPAEYADALRQWLGRIPDDDLEAKMDALREFKQTYLLRISAADSAGALDVGFVGKALSQMAEVVVAEAAAMAWRELVSRYGEPDNLDNSSNTGLPGLGILAYGKLGARELGYSSDLDLVFIYLNSEGDTQGSKSIENKTFYLRLTQKIIHILSIRTRTGVLYEVDMRLRPSGNSGLLVSDIEAFEKYQRQDAWTWEHQALSRARFLMGDPVLNKRFTSLRSEVLLSRRDPRGLAIEVTQMRKKMRDNLLQKDGSGRVDLKQAEGGLADIEFLVQYWILCYASDYPHIINATMTVRQLKNLKAVSALSAYPLDELSVKYLELRQCLNALSLQKRDHRVRLNEHQKRLMTEVAEIWAHVFAIVDESSSR